MAEQAVARPGESGTAMPSISVEPQANVNRIQPIIPALGLLHALLLPCLILAICSATSPASAGTCPPTKKTTTYSVGLKVDGLGVAGPFSSKETVTAQVLANPVGDGDDPTAWTGDATLNFGPIEDTSSHPECFLTNTPPSGTAQVAITKNGESIDVVWGESTTAGAGILACQDQIIPIDHALAQPLNPLDPRQFSLSAAGGTQTLSGSRVNPPAGFFENNGTMTVTRRIECGQKVKQVNTYPPGQQTSASSMVGKGFAVGEQVTADTNVEFVFEDGSIVRLAKGASIKEDPKCEAFCDRSKSFKGTLLLGKVWFKLTSIFGDSKVYEIPRERAVTGRRGTTFWVIPRANYTTLSVAQGSMWLSRKAKGRLTGKTYIVLRGQTAVISKTTIIVRKTRASDKFPFGVSP